MNFGQAIEVLAEFEREQVRYVLIGSMAMAAHGIIRATQAVDFFVSPDAENVAKIKRALQSVFHDESAIRLDPKIESTPRTYAKGSGSNRRADGCTQVSRYR